jgi:hypothetical protein
MKGPIEKIPDNLLNSYTMDEKIAVYKYYFDESKTISMEYI